MAGFFLQRELDLNFLLVIYDFHLLVHRSQMQSIHMV